ncbi:MAG: hypothetical protein ACKOXM_05110 [Agromyces sp.]
MMRSTFVEPSPLESSTQLPWWPTLVLSVSGYLAPIALLAGLFLIQLFAQFDPVLISAVGLPLIGGVQGLTVSLAQARATRYAAVRLGHTSWVFVSVVVSLVSCFALFGSLAWMTASRAGSADPLWSGLAGIGAVLFFFATPIAQSLVLRRHVRHSWTWVLWALLGWIALLPMVQLGFQVLPGYADTDPVYGWWLLFALAVTSLALALCTSIGLLRLERLARLR